MSAVTNIVVTPSTSLILIRSISTPTNVYLSTLRAPNFSLTIRDTTGLVSIATNSVRISTIGTAKFLDGTNLYVLDKPFGLVNIALRNSSIWQILHTSGQSPATAAANLTTLNASTLYFSFLSSGIKQASSLTVNEIFTTTSFALNSTFIIENLSAPGIVVVQSTFNAYGDVQVDRQLFVSGATRFLSSAVTRFLVPLSSVARVSSLGVGSNLNVGGTVTVGSTLQTFSTNLVDTVEVQLSTADTVFQAGSVQVGNLVSTFLSLTSLQQFATPSTLQIAQHVSSYTGTLTTNQLNVGQYAWLQQGISTTGNATFESTLTIASSLRVSQSAFVSTNAIVLGNVFTSSFSTFQFSTLSSFSTQTFQGLSSIVFYNGLSTAILQGFHWLSIGSYLYTPAVVSSTRLTQVVGQISADETATLASVHVSSSVAIGTNATITGDSFLGNATFTQTLTNSGTTSIRGPVRVTESVGVGQNATVNTTITVLGSSEISSFFVNSFLLSNLVILTSSPFTSFRASSLVACNVETRLTQIGETSPAYLLANSTFVSTTQFTLATAEATRVETVRASNVLWGSKQTSLSAESQPRFVFNTNSFFPEGLSSASVRAATFRAGRFIGSFLGDGANISNVAVPYANLSAFTTLVSTAFVSSLNTSSIFASSFQSLTQTEAISSVVTSTLTIQAIGFPPSFSTNQMLSLTSNSMVINRNVYFNRLTNRVGVNISSPEYDLDIQGVLFASNVYFSSISPLTVSSLSTISLSSIFVSTATVNSTIFYASRGIEVFTNNQAAGARSLPLEIRTLSSPISTFGIYSYTSSIGLNNVMYIYNNTQRVTLNGNFEDDPQYDFKVNDNVSCATAHFSSVNEVSQIFSRSLFTPSLRLQYPITLSTNTMSSLGTRLLLNNLLTLDNLDSGSIGIKTSSPVTSLDVRGNAFFSSLQFLGIGQANYLMFGSETL